MASVKEQTAATAQSLNLGGTTLPNADVQSVRERKGAEDVQGGELYAQIPMMPPVLLSPTGVRLHPEQTKDDGLTVRVVGAPSTAFRFDGATMRNAISSEVGAFIGDANAITNVESLPSMIDHLIQLSRQREEKFKDIRIITHGLGGKISMGNHEYSLSDPKVVDQFNRLIPYLAEGAVISFHGCEVGQKSEGLQEIANWTGAKVRASLDNQNGYPGLQGRIVTFTQQKEP